MKENNFSMILCSKIYFMHKFLASNIYNCDETEVSCAHKHQKYSCFTGCPSSRKTHCCWAVEKYNSLVLYWALTTNFPVSKARMNDSLMIIVLNESVDMA